MAAGKKSGIADRVREIAAPVAESMGLCLWDVEYVKEGADMYLRITVDKDGGLTIDDCETVSQLFTDGLAAQLLMLVFSFLYPLFSKMG